MIEVLPKLIDVLLRYRASSFEVTRLFRRKGHNKDLCPAIERQASQIIDCYIKYHNIAYDVQGIHDRGTDVLLRYSEDTESGEFERWFISFQIKSFQDINSRAYLKDLKAQCFEAQNEYGNNLQQYYILLCTDKSAHEDRIREIKKHFSSVPDVTVIDPTYVWTFLQLNTLRINAVVDSILREDDYVYQKARGMVEDLTPTEVAISLAIVYEWTFHSKKIFSVETIQERGFIKQTFKKVPDYPRGYYFFIAERPDVDIDESDKYFAQEIKDIEGAHAVKWIGGKFKPPAVRKRDFTTRFSEGLDALDGQLFSIQEETGEIEINSSVVLPIQAILLDAKVRYNYDGDELLEYTFNTLGIPELFELENF
jgi:hypothetical protein